MTSHHFICPCCGHHLAYSEEAADAIIEEVARAYRLDPHHLEYASQFRTPRAAEARSVAAYLIRVLTGAQMRTINLRFHWSEHAPEAGRRIGYVESERERNAGLNARVEALLERLRFSLAEKTAQKVA